jgi:rhamnose utilization protein RhaD (predicted bifunctional aldolase and dehydrogenase)/NAD(P)-dependent dehydrogenase (short-subunit alcohol dehydrogenase family)
MPETTDVAHLRDLWDDAAVEGLSANPLALLRYRSNLLGADLRITNFGGGNTSSKIELPDPFTGRPVRVLAVKGSGGDLGSIKESGFALLYLDRLEELKTIYRGEAHEDEMVRYYPLSAFGENRVAASIDTPLHAFLPFRHVDHLHPDWAIALAASANGKQKLEEFNRQFGRNLAWLPWQRPGFELALLLERAVKENPGCDGLILASHGLFTWGDTPRECYSNSIRTIDQMGEFILEHQNKKPVVFGGFEHEPMPGRKEIAARVLPALRGALSSNRRVIGHYSDEDDALLFAGGKWSRELAALGTSCPDHFLRTRICPLFVDSGGAGDLVAGDIDALIARIREQVEAYRIEYKRYYESWAAPDSPQLRDSNPSVVLIPGVGLFGFGKSKKEARITTEFFINAIHVMAGANALRDQEVAHPLPQARRPDQSAQFESFRNYVALPRSEAFRIEYWALEEAKLQRMPAEAEFSRKIALVVGGGNGIGREVALLLARRGAHVVVADLDAAAAATTAVEAARITSTDQIASTAADLASPPSLAEAVRFTVLQFGGLDVVVNTAAIYPVPGSGERLSDEQWSLAFKVNVTGNYLLAEMTGTVFADQKLPATMVLTSSANALVPKKGTEAYDTSTSALNHLIRELAIRLGPTVRVNGIAPATVVAGSTMFPRHRVIHSLQKYNIAFAELDSTEDLRLKLAGFYAQRTVTRQPILPLDCAQAIAWLAGDESAKTTGHIIPVDGGLPEAFLR